MSSHGTTPPGPAGKTASPEAAEARPEETLPTMDRQTMTNPPASRQELSQSGVMEMLWHYTVWIDRASKILECGEIRCTDTGIDKGERPAVWFSSEDVWEPTANKALRAADGTIVFGTMETTRNHGGGLWRFGVADETAPHNWRAFIRLSGVSQRTAAALKQAANEAGASIYKFRVSFDPVPRDKWLAVQKWNGTRWIDHSIGTNP